MDENKSMCEILAHLKVSRNKINEACGSLILVEGIAKQENLFPISTLDELFHFRYMLNLIGKQIDRLVDLYLCSLSSAKSGENG